MHLKRRKEQSLRAAEVHSHHTQSTRRRLQSGGGFPGLFFLLPMWQLVIIKARWPPSLPLFIMVVVQK